MEKSVSFKLDNELFTKFVASDRTQYVDARMNFDDWMSNPDSIFYLHCSSVKYGDDQKGELLIKFEILDDKTQVIVEESTMPKEVVNTKVEEVLKGIFPAYQPKSVRESQAALFTPLRGELEEEEDSVLSLEAEIQGNVLEQLTSLYNVSSEHEFSSRMKDFVNKKKAKVHLKSDELELKAERGGGDEIIINIVKLSDEGGEKFAELMKAWCDKNGWDYNTVNINIRIKESLDEELQPDKVWSLVGALINKGFYIEKDIFRKFEHNDNYHNMWDMNQDNNPKPEEGEHTITL